MRHPDRIPVIVKRASDETVKKYLVQKAMLVAEFLYVLRKDIHDKDLDAGKTIYLMASRFDGFVALKSSLNIEEVYSRYGDPDGFVYLHYRSENTLGAD